MERRAILASKRRTWGKTYIKRQDRRYIYDRLGRKRGGGGGTRKDCP